MVNDDVMGGVSTGSCRVVHGYFEFSRQLSTRNNGGFASCYFDNPNANVSDFKAFELDLIGDGNTYGFNIISESNRGLVHRYYFPTEKDQRIKLTIPYSSFSATRRWKNFGNIAFDTRSVYQIGVIAYAKRNTSFRLKVISILVRDTVKGYD